MGCGIDDVGSLHEMRKQKGMHLPIHAGISAHHVPLRIDCVCVDVGAVGNIDGNAVTVDYEGPMVVAIKRAISAYHPALRVDPAEECKCRAWAIDRLEGPVDE